MNRYQLQKTTGILFMMKSILLLIGSVVLLFGGIGLIVSSNKTTPDTTTPGDTLEGVGQGIAQGCAKVIGIFTLIAFVIVLMIGLVYLLLSKNLVFKKTYPKQSAVSLFVFEIITFFIAGGYTIISLSQQLHATLAISYFTILALTSVNIVMLSLLFKKVKQQD